MIRCLGIWCKTQCPHPSPFRHARLNRNGQGQALKGVRQDLKNLTGLLNRLTCGLLMIKGQKMNW